jgi:hypothetical protein
MPVGRASDLCFREIIKAMKKELIGASFLFSKEQQQQQKIQQKNEALMIPPPLLRPTSHFTNVFHQHWKQLARPTLQRILPEQLWREFDKLYHIHLTPNLSLL